MDGATAEETHNREPEQLDSGPGIRRTSISADEFPACMDLVAKALEEARYQPTSDLSAVFERAKSVDYPPLLDAPTLDANDSIIFDYEGGYEGFSCLSYDWWNHTVSLLEIVVYMERAGLAWEDCGRIAGAYKQLWERVNPDDETWMIPWAEAFLLAVRCGFAIQVYPLFETGRNEDVDMDQIREMRRRQSLSTSTS